MRHAPWRGACSTHTIVCALGYLQQALSGGHWRGSRACKTPAGFALLPRPSPFYPAHLLPTPAALAVSRGICAGGCGMPALRGAGAALCDAGRGSESAGRDGILRSLRCYTAPATARRALRQRAPPTFCPSLQRCFPTGETGGWWMRGMPAEKNWATRLWGSIGLELDSDERRCCTTTPTKTPSAITAAFTHKRAASPAALATFLCAPHCYR